jgi:hypothetical protein
MSEKRFLYRGSIVVPLNLAKDDPKMVRVRHVESAVTEWVDLFELEEITHMLEEKERHRAGQITEALIWNLSHRLEEDGP